MATRSWCFFILLFAAIMPISASAQTSGQTSAAGKNFWMAFPQNAKYEFGQALKHFIVVTAVEAAEVTVTAPAMTPAGTRLAEGKALQKGETYTFDLDSSLQSSGSEKIESKGIHIGSTGLVSVTALSVRKASNDAYRIMPSEALGKEYMIIGYDPPSSDQSFTTQFNIIASQNDTKVRINLTSSTKGGRKAGETIEVTLDRGQCYAVQGSSASDKDLTGSMVFADKPVAVLTGHSCAQVPSQFIYCDVLIEMAAPISTAGVDFIAPMMQAKDGYALRILATQPQTTIAPMEGGGSSGLSAPLVLDAGQHHDVKMATGNWRIRSNKPIIVAQYGLSNEADSSKVGDPFMTMLAPISAYTSNTTFSTPPLKGNWRHYISIVCDQEAARSLKINGNPVSTSMSQRVDASDFVVFQEALIPGIQVVTSNGKLAVYSYGFGYGADNFDSYGTYCGPW
jgi:hypothetical protein